ncbi:unnamed protein product [Cladocopium goreaui]|uniref:RRM domain-containing protein n=1 Tax=Cladocopium goreaui TaxID=2562237 RepID=A0A9P1M2M2_9DINO|nr:unnamed protein product [Cladocopium goreaui]
MGDILTIFSFPAVAKKLKLMFRKQSSKSCASGLQEMWRMKRKQNLQLGIECAESWALELQHGRAFVGHELADVYVEHLELREVEERLSRRPALPPLPPPPRRRTSHAAAEVERQLNEILKGICVKGRFSVQSSNERSDTVARASLVVEEGPSELLNRVVRVYSLKDRNRAKQGDHVWVELRSCVLDRAALERGGPGTWCCGERAGLGTMSQALSYVCIFGAVLRATPPMGVAARSCYLCKQSQMQWKPGVLNFIPFSHEVPMLQVMVEREEREQPLDDVFQLAMVDWPVNRLRPLAVIVERLAVPRPLSLERSLEIFLKDLDFLQDPEDPKVQEMADEAVDLMTPEEELNIIDAQRRELDGQIFSIDAAGANIIDDALEYDLEEQVVRVHIADVAASVCSGGDLDLYAARRGCSVFIRDHKEELQRCEPMLPACVTFQTSLDKNQWRRALTFEFRVGEQLQFLGFFRSWVRSKEQLSFQAAEGLMSGTDTGTRTPPGVLRSLRALWQWTRAELEKRKARGRVAALQAFLSTASARNSQEGDAESLVEFWTRQVNEESGRILATSCDISYCFPCPDAHHFSRLAVLCREALLRAGDVAQDELLLKLRSSPEECQESLAEILSHVTRLSTSTQRGSMAGRRYAGAEGFGFGAPG